MIVFLQPLNAALFTEESFALKVILDNFLQFANAFLGSFLMFLFKVIFVAFAPLKAPALSVATVYFALPLLTVAGSFKDKGIGRELLVFVLDEYGKYGPFLL